MSCNNKEIYLTSEETHISVVQELRNLSQIVFGMIPEYFQIMQDEGFQEQGIFKVKVTVGKFSEVQTRRRMSQAIRSVSKSLVATLRNQMEDMHQNLNNYLCYNVEKFIKHQRMLLDLELDACAGFLKEMEKQGKRYLGKVEVAEVSIQEYGYALVTFWRIDNGHPLDISAGCPVFLRGSKTQDQFGIVVSVKEAQVVVSVRKNQWVFSKESKFQMGKIDGINELHKLKIAVGNAMNPSNQFTVLRDVLFGLKYPGELPPLSKPLKYKNSSLDVTQQKTVEFVLRQKELSIIQGPPGTGKTTTVVEVILQTITRGTKVLVTAPSNAAVDNILEKLLHFTPNGKGKIVRIGQPARVCKYLQTYTIDAATKDQSKVVEALRKDIALIQEELDLNLDGFTKQREELNKRRDELKHKLGVAYQVMKKARSKALLGADVVLCTITGCDPDGLIKLLPSEHFGLAVIDECGQALEAACWLVVPLAPRLLLAGDHRQLPPTVHSLDKNVQEQLSISMMERLLQIYRVSDHRVVMMLDVQYRMNRQIMQWSSDTFYQGKLYASPIVSDQTLAQLPCVRPVDGFTEPIILVDTVNTGMREVKSGDSKSLTNVGEARIVCHIVRQLMDSGVTARDLGVITPYSKQVELLQLNLETQFQ